jgi:hypothetical protein
MKVICCTKEPSLSSVAQGSGEGDAAPEVLRKCSSMSRNAGLGIGVSLPSQNIGTFLSVLTC